MRWVVELPASNGGTAANVTVDADSWAGALTHARGGSPIKKFRCEFDADNVVRVLDLGSREWYTIKPIRVATSDVPAAGTATEIAATTEATDGSSAQHAAEAPATSSPPQPFALALDEEPQPLIPPAVVAPGEPEAESEPSPPAAVEASASEPEGTARPHDTLFGVAPPGADESRLVAVADPPAEHEPSGDSLPTPTLLFERDQDPSDTNPLTYRERVFSLPEGTSIEVADQVARHALGALKRALATRPRGRYVVVAVFDHEFRGRPERGALVELRWRDWRAEVEVKHPVAEVSPARVELEPPPPEVRSADESGAIVNGSAIVAAATEAASITLPSEPDVAPSTQPAVAEPAPPTAALGGASPVSADPEAPAEAPQPEASVPETASAASPSESEPAAAAEEPPAPTPPSETVEVAPPLTAAEPATAEPTEAATEEQTSSEAPGRDESPADSLGTSPESSLSVEEAPGAAAPIAEPSAPSPEPAPPTSASSVGGAVTEAQAEAVASNQDGEGAASAESSAQAESPAPAPAPMVARKLSRRLRGKDLLSELFDELMGLSHMEDIEDAAKHVSAILFELIECDVAAVSTYEIDSDEFVVVNALGVEGAKSRRVRATVGAAAQVVRKRSGIKLAACGVEDALVDGGGSGGGIFAPATHRERLFGLVQLRRVEGAEGFDDDELDALSYVAAQFGEFLSTQSKKAAAVEFAPQPRRSVAPSKR